MAFFLIICYILINLIMTGKISRKKLVVILGPTASGKTWLAVELARKFNGEIISADSRQVYRGMDIGTGKDLSEYKEIPYHLIDIVNPRDNFNVAKYQKLAYAAIDDVLRRGKLSLLVGGTGLYIDAVIKGYEFNNIKYSILNIKKIRQKLNQQTLIQLLSKLKRVDLITYNQIDKKNRRRVQRAMEIFYETGRTKSETDKKSAPDYDILILGITFPLEKIYRKIDSRLETRLKEGMIKEVKGLRKKGVSWKKLEEFGLEYRYVARYLRGLITHEELVEQLKNAIHHFAKRQLTWFKRNKDIIWIGNKMQAQKLVNNFIKKKPSV